MSKRGSSKPALAVVGIGDYYSKLRPGLSKYFHSVALIDSNPSAKDTLKTSEQQLFRVCTEPKDLGKTIKFADLVLILTPNDLHVPYAVEAIKLGKATAIEKPIATSYAAIEALRREVGTGVPLYCSDFYVDVRAIPLLAITGHIPAGDWRLDLIRGGDGKPPAPIDIGNLVRIEGRIAESYPFPVGSWLGRKDGGGVIFDMMVHLFALLKRLLPNESLAIHSCERLYTSLHGPQSSFLEEPPTPEAAEAYGRLEGELTRSGAQLTFEVLKGAPQTDRYFRLVGSRGSATQLFQPEHHLHAVAGPRTVSLALEGDRYELACLAMRKWSDSRAAPYGWPWSAWAAEQAIAAREWPAVLTGKPRQRVFRHLHEDSGKPDDPSKRRLMEGFMAVTALATLGFTALGDYLIWTEVQDKRQEKMTKPSGTVTLDLQRGADKLEAVLDTDRMAAIKGLVGSGDRLLLVPGSEHLDARSFRGRGYPHDLNALAPFRHIGDSAAALDVDDILAYVEDRDVVVGTGSPTSSQLARQVMASGSPLVQSLPYHIEEIEGERFVKVISGMLGGEQKKRGKRLIDSTGQELSTDRNNVSDTGWLERDVLLVSRVPSGYRNCDLLLLSGGHGAGTQAIELLFDPRIISTEEIDKLCRCLANHQYWQFVLDVTEIHHQVGFMSVAHSARINWDFPPKVLLHDCTRS